MERHLMADRPARRLSNRAIIGLGLGLCVALAVVLAWLFGLMA